MNSQIWSGYLDLEVIEHQILQAITGAQAKVPTKMLYMDKAQIPFKSVISVRRLLYLHTILTRHENELTKQIYSAMYEERLKDDWTHRVKQYKEQINLNITD